MNGLTDSEKNRILYPDRVAFYLVVSGKRGNELTAHSHGDMGYGSLNFRSEPPGKRRTPGTFIACYHQTLGAH